MHFIDKIFAIEFLSAIFVTISLFLTNITIHSMGSQKLRHDWVTNHTHMNINQSQSNIIKKCIFYFHVLIFIFEYLNYKSSQELIYDHYHIIFTYIFYHINFSLSLYQEKAP